MMMLAPLAIKEDGGTSAQRGGRSIMVQVRITRSAPADVPNLAASIGKWVRDLACDLFDPYQPELHYMRGPGPKWREKHGQRPASDTRDFAAHQVCEAPQLITN